MRQLLILILLFLTGCGFHLRGSVELPAELSDINVVDAGGASLITPDLRDALRDRDIRISDTASMALRARAESYSKRVLSVDTSGRATEYGLSYKVRISLQAADGSVWLPEEVITIHRDLRFDASAVLATSGEESVLQEEMRRDAVLQILRRLQYAKKPAQDEKIKENVPEPKS